MSYKLWITFRECIFQTINVYRVSADCLFRTRVHCTPFFKRASHWYKPIHIDWRNMFQHNMSCLYVSSSITPLKYISSPYFSSNDRRLPQFELHCNRKSERYLVDVIVVVIVHKYIRVSQSWCLVECILTALCWMYLSRFELIYWRKYPKTGGNVSARTRHRAMYGGGIVVAHNCHPIKIAAFLAGRRIWNSVRGWLSGFV